MKCSAVYEQDMYVVDDSVGTLVDARYVYESNESTSSTAPRQNLDRVKYV